MRRLVGFQHIKAVALAVTDRGRAEKFYSETLDLAPAFEDGRQAGFSLGQTILLLKDSWYGTPTEMPNPRITIATDDAMAIESVLKEKGVVISDPVQAYDDGFYVGSFLDSEGNKLWFCSPIERKKS